MATMATFLTEYYIMMGFGYDTDEAFECAYNEINGDWDNPTMIAIARSWTLLKLEETA